MRVTKYVYVCVSILISLLLSVILMFSTKLMFGINTAKEFYFFAVVSLCSFYSLIFIFVNKKVVININICDILLALFCVWCVIRSSSSFLNADNIKILSLYLVYFVIKIIIDNRLPSDEKFNKNMIYSIFLILFLLSIIESVVGFLQLYKIIPSLNNKFQITGTTINPAIFSFFLAVVLPCSLAFYLIKLSDCSYIKILKKVSLLAMLIMASILPLTLIRASWIGSIAGCIFVFYFFRKGMINKKFSFIYKNWKITTILLVLFSILIATSLYQLKSQSAFGRLLVWEISSNKIADDFLLGVGYKRFQVTYNKWQADYFLEKARSLEKIRVADNVEFAYNEYLQILIEVGFLGFLLFILVLYFFIKQICAAIKRNEMNENSCAMRYILIISCCSIVVSILTMSMFSYPLQTTSIAIIFFICLGVFSSNLVCNKPLLIFKNNYAKIIYACFSLFMFFLPMSQFSTIDSYFKWKYAVIEYNNLNYANSLEIYRKIYPNLYNNGLFLQYYGTTLVAAGECDKGIEMLEKAKEYISDPIINMKIGNCKRVQKEYREAEANYLFASAMIPNRIYPKYLLALLYDESFQYEKAYKWAKMIIEIKEKIPSTAIDEMKEEMLNLVKKYENENLVKRSFISKY